MTKNDSDQKREASETPTELSIDQAVKLAVGLQQRNAMKEAEIIYQRILALIPEHPDALHFLGVLKHQSGRSEEAIELLSKALQAAPEYVDARNNLGNIYREHHRLDDAETCYRRVIKLTPKNASAYNNLGTVLRARGLILDAQAAYQKAIELDPNSPGPHENMGNLLSQQGKVTEAVAYYSQAIALNPDHPGYKRMLGIALACNGRLEEAANMFREWIEKEPDHPVAHHLLAACSADEIPKRASDGYIKHVFDSFAWQFEERLEHLDYRAPKLILVAFEEAFRKPAGDLDILDARCGTGLCGPLLRPYAGWLEGVDLSPQMLRRAELTGCYDSLKEAELTQFIGERQGSYDVIVSADTLCYFGDLQKVMTAVAASVRPGGQFIFTVERAEEDVDGMSAGYRINPNGRYTHKESYTRRILTQAGLKIGSLTHDTLRREMGRPVAGLVVTALVQSGKGYSLLPSH